MATTAERYSNCCVREASRSGGGSVMVWGGISWRYRTPLVVIEGNLTARRYIDEVLQPVVVPFLRNHVDVMLFQQDNARLHSARLTRYFLENNNTHVLPWSAFSPDLSHIEHLWDLGRRVFDGRRHIHNQQQLIEVLNREFEAISQYRNQRLIRRMRHRCLATIAVNGGHTRY
ncbi:MAG: transposase [Candidatus Thiodiazotropha sp.]